MPEIAGMKRGMFLGYAEHQFTLIMVDWDLQEIQLRGRKAESQRWRPEGQTEKGKSGGSREW